MNIAFWTPFCDSIGVTSNMACISALFSMMFRFKTILLENHQQRYMIESFVRFRTNQHLIYENSKYHYEHTGMNSIFYNLSLKEETYYNNDRDYKNVVKMIEGVSNELLDNQLFYIPYGNRTNRLIYDYDLNKYILTILKASKIFADLTFIDTRNNDSLSSQVILNEADLIVVNLSQNQKELHCFFKDYSSIVSRCIFLISNYDHNSYFNLQKISKNYSIDQRKIAAIPFNLEYQEALEYGMLLNFLISNYRCKKSQPNYTFMRELRIAALKLYNCVKQTLEEKENIRQ